MPDDESETTDTTDSTRVKYLPEFFLSVQQGILQVMESASIFVCPRGLRKRDGHDLFCTEDSTVGI